VDFAQGRGLGNALDGLQRTAEAKYATATRASQDFCGRHQIPSADQGARQSGVTANWLEEKGDAARRFVLQARHHDLVVVGRPSGGQRAQRSLVEQLLLASGRPVVIAPQVAPGMAGRLAMIGWKETPEAAHALAAAMPILVNSERVILAGVEDGDSGPRSWLDAVARHLGWHGIVAQTQVISADGRSIAHLLHAAAEAANADLLILGAYGRSRVRELVFGGVTQSFLEGAAMPILLAH